MGNAEHDAPSLLGFLEELSLKASSDEKNLYEDAVRLMTLHNGKGLEFELAFMSSAWKKIFFPISTAKETPAANSKRRGGSAMLA